jgi:hypothetical protein
VPTNPSLASRVLKLTLDSTPWQVRRLPAVPVFAEYAPQHDKDHPKSRRVGEMVSLGGNGRGRALIVEWGIVGYRYCTVLLTPGRGTWGRRRMNDHRVHSDWRDPGRVQSVTDLSYFFEDPVYLFLKYRLCSVKLVSPYPWIHVCCLRHCMVWIPVLILLSAGPEIRQSAGHALVLAPSPLTQ